MGSTSALFWGMVFGSFGLGYFIYGKKQQRLVPLFCGVLLMVFPYFVSSTLAMLLVGAALCAAPFLFRH